MSEDQISETVTSDDFVCKQLKNCNAQYSVLI